MRSNRTLGMSEWMVHIYHHSLNSHTSHCYKPINPATLFCENPLMHKQRFLHKGPFHFIWFLKIQFGWERSVFSLSNLCKLSWRLTTSIMYLLDMKAAVLVMLITLSATPSKIEITFVEILKLTFKIHICYAI